VAAQPIPSESTTTTTTTTKYRPPQPGLLSNVHLSTDAAVIGILAGLAYLFTLRRPVTTAPAATGTAPTSAASIAATTGVTSPPPSPPGAPAELYELGATAHSVLVACSPVTGAVAYEWREYGTDLILARSPTNVALIEGLQANTMYQVYCVAIGYDGQPGPPSAPLLVSTTPSGPVVYVGQPQQVQVVLQMLTTPGAAPNAGQTAQASATTAPTPLGPVTVTVPATTPVGVPVTVSATVANVPASDTVTWTGSVTGQDGTVVGTASGSGPSFSFSVTPLTAQTYTVTVTASAAGQQATGQATFVAAPAQKPTSVTVTGPTSGTVGQVLTFQAQATGVPRAVYQFWYYPPGGASPTSEPTEQNGWVSSGSYSLNNLFQLVPQEPGTYYVTAYARSVTAPSGDQAYKTQGNTLTVTVTGSTSAVGAPTIPPLTPHPGTPNQTQFNQVPSGYGGPTVTIPTQTPNGPGTLTVPVVTSSAQIPSGGSGAFSSTVLQQLFQAAKQLPPGYTGYIRVPNPTGGYYDAYAQNGNIATALPTGQPVVIQTGS